MTHANRTPSRIRSRRRATVRIGSVISRAVAAAATCRATRSSAVALPILARCGGGAGAAAPAAAAVPRADGPLPLAGPWSCCHWPACVAVSFLGPRPLRGRRRSPYGKRALTRLRCRRRGESQRRLPRFGCRGTSHIPLLTTTLLAGRLSAITAPVSAARGVGVATSRGGASPVAVVTRWWIMMMSLSPVAFLTRWLMVITLAPIALGLVLACPPLISPRRLAESRRLCFYAPVLRLRRSRSHLSSRLLGSRSLDLFAPSSVLTGRLATCSRELHPQLSLLIASEYGLLSVPPVLLCELQQLGHLHILSESYAELSEFALGNSVMQQHCQTKKVGNT
mmetsp:Transcript_47984/g.114042  ORF Transcript_47984/g.114042 Transcript_47984/m.114042 type:complete len:337 (+) Transcript_47984:240-1250(+)